MSNVKRKAQKDRFIAAIPKMLILWSAFLILAKVNTSFVILAFFTPILYSVYSYQEFVPKKFLKACGLHYIIALLAVVATHSLPLLILINILGMFSICYYFCTDLSPNGYSIYLLEFVFLQMRPLKFTQIPTLLCILTIIFIFMFILLGIRQLLLNKKKQSPKLYHMALKDIADFLNQLSKHPEDMEEITQKIKASTDIFYRKYYASSTFPGTISYKSILDYYMIVILNRTQVMPKLLPEQISIEDKEHLLKLSQLFENCHQNINQTDNQPLLENIALMKASYPSNQSNINEHIATIFTLLENILKKVVEDKKTLEKPLASGITMASAYIKMHGFHNYIQMNKFRFAFALRMTLVAVVTWVISRYIPSSFAYWLPLNTLFMLNPTYEASKKASNDRILGNLVGCICLFVLIYLLPFQWTPIVLFIVCSGIGYSWVQREWSSNVWSGIYGTAMISISLGVGEAIWLKLLFLLAGYVVAILASRYLFSKPNKVVFTDNFRNIGILLEDELNMMTQPRHDKKRMASTIYWMMQLHFTEDQMVKYAKEQYAISQDDTLMNNCDLLKELSDTIQNIFYLMINLEDQTDYLASLEELKGLLNKFVAQNDGNLLENIELMSQIQEEATNILVDLKKEQYLQDAFVFAE